ncbi:MAG: ATP-binding protein, partial [Cyanobacteria bacterium P01_D01_bin.14]
MTDLARWQEHNEAYLATALAWLRQRLVTLIQTADEGTAAACDPHLPEAGEEMTALPPPALLLLSQRLGLSVFEQEILLLCAAMELDTRIAGLCAQAQNNLNAPYPTFALAFALFDEPAWEVLSPERPLRYWRLLEITQPGAQPLTASPLRADERILNYLKGLNYL